MPGSILLVDDDPQSIRHLALALTPPPDSFEVTSVDTASDALRHLASHDVSCVLLDYRLPDSEGLSVLRCIRHRRPEVPVVMLTGAGSEEVAVAALKLGATDYLVKHGAWVDGVPAAVREAVGRQALVGEAPRSGGEEPLLASEHRARYRAAGIIGESPALAAALRLTDRATATDATVLLEGETGTGKELFARAIHRHGRRARGPFVGVNCAAVPDSLLEAELFGHVRGAFSGAERDRRGLFEEASGGTLFLDEISEMPLATQAKLLRVLQEGEVRPLGASRTRIVDVRVISGANRDLRLAVDEGSFRIDLFHRLHVLPIRLPALRDRRSDVPLLARHFLADLAAQEGKAPLDFGPDVLEILRRHRWPGNVRELRNTIHMLVVCAEARTRIGVSLLPARLLAHEARAGFGTRPLKEIVRDVEVATIAARLRENGYHRTATARSLGLTREGLWQKLRQLRLQPPARDLNPPE